MHPLRLAIVLAVVAAAAGCRTGDDEARPGDADCLEPGIHVITAGFEASVTVPDGDIDGIVLDLHGFGSDRTQQAAYSGLAARAMRRGFVGVTPSARNVPRRWELDDDVAALDALLDEVEARVCAEDPLRFAAGLSNGAAMTSVLACSDEVGLDGAGAVAGVVFPSAACEPVVPIVAFHGTADDVLAYEGGPVGTGGPFLGFDYPPVEESMDRWAAHHGCGDEVSETELGDTVRRRWTGCPDGADVELYTVDGGGHTWPGAVPFPPLGPTTDDIEASDLLLVRWRELADRGLRSDP